MGSDSGDDPDPSSPAPSTYHRPWAAVSIAVLTLAATGAFHAWFRPGGALGSLPPTAAVAVEILVGSALLAGATAVAVRVAARVGFTRATGLAPWRIADLVFGLGLGLAVRAVVELAAPTTGTVGGPLGGGVVAGGVVLAAIAAVALSPLVEELFFRGLLQRALADGLRGVGRVLAAAVAITVTTAAFTLIHVVVAGGADAALLVGTFGVGVGCGILTVVTGRLGGAIVAHVTFNAIGVGLLLV
jgi:membrane protease YdiL (CAAX protease family)